MQNKYYVTITAANNAQRVRVSAHTTVAHLRLLPYMRSATSFTVHVHCAATHTAQLGYTSVHNTLEEALAHAHKQHTVHCM